MLITNCQFSRIDSSVVFFSSRLNKYEKIYFLTCISTVIVYDAHVCVCMFSFSHWCQINDIVHHSKIDSIIHLFVMTLDNI